MPRKPYDPKPVKRHVRKVPVRGERALGMKGDIKDYHIRVLGENPKEVVLLRDLLGKVPEWETNKETMMRYGGLERVHNLPVDSGRIFTGEGKKNLIDASRIIAENAQKGRNVVLTCNRGYRRTAAALYLTHRRMGASHEEAMRHAFGPGYENAFSEREKEGLKGLFEKRGKYEKK
jgi:rhodanese-related sulfurtransferase